jgi:hypothetical protein
MPTSAVAFNGRGKAHASLQRYHAPSIPRLPSTRNTRPPIRTAARRVLRLGRTAGRRGLRRPSSSPASRTSCCSPRIGDEIQHGGRGSHQGDRAQARPRRRISNAALSMRRSATPDAIAGSPGHRARARRRPRHARRGEVSNAAEEARPVSTVAKQTTPDPFAARCGACRSMQPRLGSLRPTPMRLRLTDRTRLFPAHSR